MTFQKYTIDEVISNLMKPGSDSGLSDISDESDNEDIVIEPQNEEQMKSNTSSSETVESMYMYYLEAVINSCSE